MMSLRRLGHGRSIRCRRYVGAAVSLLVIGVWILVPTLHRLSDSERNIMTRSSHGRNRTAVEAATVVRREVAHVRATDSLSLTYDEACPLAGTWPPAHHKKTRQFIAAMAATGPYASRWFYAGGSSLNALRFFALVRRLRLSKNAVV